MTKTKTYRSREFRPWRVLYLPIYFQYVGYMLWTRNATYFYDVNPGMPPTWGILKFSKRQLLHQLDPKRIPQTVYFVREHTTKQDNQLLASCSFPCIVKPDNDERGNSVTLLHTAEELKNHLHTVTSGKQYLMQDYIDYPVEVGVFWYQLPGTKKGNISGITTKEFTFVTGDGVSTLEQLVITHPRAHLHKALFAKQHAADRATILPLWVVKQLNVIGNHCKGTKFLDGKQLISADLIAHIQTILAPLNEFYYWRIDLRVASIEDLLEGKNIKIMEINGAQSEPTHMYDPIHTVRDWYRAIIWHRHMMFRIAQANRHRWKKLLIPFFAHMKKTYTCSSAK